MPELPEVEAARRLVEKHCKGKALVDVVSTEAGGHARDGEFDSIVFDDPDLTAEGVRKYLSGKKLKAVHRKGKQLWLELSSGPHLLAHFGMTGAFVVRGVQPMEYQEFKVRDETWPPRFTKLELVFEGETRLAFCDPRRLGRLRLRADPTKQPPWADLAPDALLEPVSLERATAMLGAKGCPIKALLLDQNTMVSGVGNWVADEVLFSAAIHPEAVCNTLSHRQISALIASMHTVLSTACEANANSTSFPSDWLFHVRWGKGKGGAVAPRVPGPNGGPISFMTVGGRTSAVVVSRQKKGEGRTTDSDSAAKNGTSGGSKAAKASKGKAARRQEPAEAVEPPAKRSKYFSKRKKA